MTLLAPFVSGLAILTALASVAEIILASWVLHYLNILHDQVNYSYGDIQESSSDPIIPFHQNLTFEQSWVLVPDASIWAIPGCELAAGIIAFVLQIIIFIHIGKLWISRQPDVPKFGARQWLPTALMAFLVLAVVALFIYVFAASGISASQTNLGLNGPNGPVGFDTAPTWEVWTCAVSSLLDRDAGVPAARGEWKTICRLTVCLLISRPFRHYTDSSIQNHRLGHGGRSCPCSSWRYSRHPLSSSSSTVALYIRPKLVPNRWRCLK